MWKYSKVQTSTDIPEVSGVDQNNISEACAGSNFQEPGASHYVPGNPYPYPLLPSRQGPAAVLASLLLISKTMKNL